jgi:S1-C subfamily serine protease
MAMSKVVDLLSAQSSTVTIMHWEAGKWEPEGSGFFIADRWIATNVHVIDGEPRIGIKLYGNHVVYEVEKVKCDFYFDLAILSLNRDFGPPGPFKVNKEFSLKLGSPVSVIGTPLGNLTLEGTITYGNVSRLSAFDPDIKGVFQMSAPIEGGSSGGPVLNNELEVVGITVAGMILELREADISLPYNFAIYSNYLKMLMENDEEWRRFPINWGEKGLRRSYLSKVFED